MIQENNDEHQGVQARDTDERIRRLLAQTPTPDRRTVIQSRVFARIRRRRMLTRVACAAMVTVLVAVGLHAIWPSNPTPHALPIAQQDTGPDAWLDSLDTRFLSAPPPVAALDLVNRDQHALLDHLKSLDGVQQ